MLRNLATGRQRYVEFNLAQIKKVVKFTAMAIIPPDTDSFIFFDLMILDDLLDGGEVSPKLSRTNFSPTYFYNGHIRSSEQIKQEYPTYFNLVLPSLIPKCDRGIRVQSGELRPFYNEDKLLLEAGNGRFKLFGSDKLL